MRLDKGEGGGGREGRIIKAFFLGHHLLSFFSQATISIKISNFLICFCSFDLSCPILEKDNFNKSKKLSCLVLLYRILF